MIAALLLGLFACVIHEFGHIVAAYFTGLSIKKIGWSWIGPYIVRPLSPEMWKNFVVTLAGPLANVLASALFYTDGSTRIAWANLFIGLFQLIPFKHSDGWRLIQYVSGKYQVLEPERNA